MSTVDPQVPCVGDCRSPEADLDLIGEVAAAIDCAGRVVRVNEAWTAVATAAGSTAGAVGPGISYLDACDGARGRFTGGAATAAAGIRSVLRGEEDSFSLDYPCRSEGVDRWFTLRVSPFGVGCVGAIVTHHEITALKRAELAAVAAGGRPRRAGGQVRRIARRLETQLLQRIPASVVIIDDVGVVVYWNGCAAAMSGTSSDEVVGRTMDDLGLGPADPDLVDEMRAGVATRGRWEGEYDGRRADGSVVSVHSTVERVDDLDLDFRGVVVMTIDVSDRRRLEESLSFQALHDDLTGLPNRRLFVDELTRALARGERSHRAIAVMSIDLDGFREVNATHGPFAGDDVLRLTATRIRSALRGGDAVARLGGDTFVACIEDLDDAAAADDLALQLRGALHEPFEIGDATVTLTASIGMAVVRSSAGATGVMRNADAALAAAKISGTGRIEVYDDAAAREARQQKRLVADLEQALDVGEIHAAFQPEVALATGELVGFEALARWSHPERGAVPPDAFIPIAEESGLVSRITRVILNESCQAMAAWGAVDPDRRLYVAVNISPRQLSEPGLARMVRNAISAAGIEPGALCLEVTESALADVEAAAAALLELRAIGVRIALDDFGTGYSSLGHLHRFALDYLKIDRSFVGSMVQPPQDEAIISAVIAVARAMGLRTIAEGIEEPHQVERLTAMGCDIGQGYLWSRAVPASAATALVRTWSVPHR